ncbi:hypothetical protein QTP88_004200 [Uroleucon formosanum]
MGDSFFRCKNGSKALKQHHLQQHSIFPQSRHRVRVRVTFTAAVVIHCCNDPRGNQFHETPSASAYYAGAIHGVFRVVFRRIQNALVYIAVAIHDGCNTPRFYRGGQRRSACVLADERRKQKINIWNTSCRKYRNRDVKLKDWDDIGGSMNLNFKDFTGQQKEDYIILFVFLTHKNTLIIL